MSVFPKSEAALVALLQEIIDSGISLSIEGVAFRPECGIYGDTLWLSATEAVTFMADPDALRAGQLGLSPSDYRDWKELSDSQCGARVAEGRRCTAVTQSGRRCQREVRRRDLFDLSPKQQLDYMRGEKFCSQHDYGLKYRNSDPRKRQDAYPATP